MWQKRCIKVGEKVHKIPGCTPEIATQEDIMQFSQSTATLLIGNLYKVVEG